MFMTQAEIDACTAWLLVNATAPVKHLTYKHLLRNELTPETLPALWQAVETSRQAQDIFSRQNPDGSWFSGGPWGPQGYRHQTGSGYTSTRPKFVTTAWILPFLGQMGFTVQDERVRKSCESILLDTRYPPPGTAILAANCCGLLAIPLRAFASIGLASDARLQGGWEQLLHCQRIDGGWLNPNHLPDAKTPSTTRGRWPWERSCAWGSYYAAEALHYSGLPEHKPALQAALEFLLWHLAQKDLTEIQTWVYHGHNIVKELFMFTEGGIDIQEKPIQSILTWLKGFYRPAEGHFRAQDKPVTDFTRQISTIMKAFEDEHGPGYWDRVPKASSQVLRYHLFHLVEDDWLTYYATRIGQNVLSSGSTMG